METVTANREMMEKRLGEYQKAFSERRVSYWLDEDTLSGEDWTLLAESGEAYQALEEMWLVARESPEMRDEHKEEWIGFTHLLTNGISDEKDILKECSRLKKMGEGRLAKAVERFLAYKKELDL